jgi:ribosomal 50S subunit-recycling heat shock protein
MRIDKFLKVSRLLKRRTLAQEACDGGRISVNGRVVKPSYNIKIGDIVEIAFNSGAVKIEILDVKETVKKEQAENLYRIITED